MLEFVREFGAVTDMMPQETPVICVVAATGVSTSSLIGAVTATDPGQVSMDRLGHAQLPWHISNKYYTASVVFRFHTVSYEACGDRNRSGLVSPQTCSPVAVVPPLPKEAEALLLVFDATQAATFHMLQAWLCSQQQLAQASGGRDDAQQCLLGSIPICVVVATKLDELTRCSGAAQVAGEVFHGLQTANLACRSQVSHSTASAHLSAQPQQLEQQLGLYTSERPAWLLAAQEWCNDHMLEYIESSALHVCLDQQLQLDGHLQGIRRLQEVLHSHVWPGYSPSIQPSKIGNKGIGTGKASDMPAGVVTGAGSNLLAPTLSKTLEALHACNQQQVLRGDGYAAPGSDQMSTAAREAGLEDAVELYDQMLGEAQSARGRLAALPDNIRRREAALLAIRFATMLGCDRCSDDDFGSDSSSDL